MPDIVLAAGAWEARLRPGVGGCLSALTLGDTPVLRTMADRADHPLQSACFPLVPYCNRIAHGCFRFGGREVALDPNLGDHPHPLHGTGWLREWRVIRHDETSALLEDDYPGGADWPWPYRAHQHIALDKAGCTIRLIVENRADEPAPLGSGLHPYFRRAPDSRIAFDAHQMLGIDGDALADGTGHPADSLAPWSEGSALPDTLVDHCFTGWSGAATVTDTHGTIRLRGFGAPHVHIFAPPGGEELCIEPVSHPPDALNQSPEAMPIVQPGCAVGIALRIEADQG
ncbi:aldose 1-epimerase [Alteriqipengyuania lutimaris]|uniref:aldose 1-epimerase n=1 Tax=Alteriqipengyuania lutimaris TaxID=1538146 RepID=UPI0015F1B083|nr:aldose 1-epimerase [Alteriqipengyuania lutimaris]MBB3033672.1 aldose 1-epimerase [Alteriqipengyuania lutimaris]